MATAYELICGGTEVEEFPNGVRVVLWHEHKKYHVRAHDHKRSMRLAWEVFDTLVPARRAFQARAYFAVTEENYRAWLSSE